MIRRIIGKAGSSSRRDRCPSSSKGLKTTSTSSTEENVRPTSDGPTVPREWIAAGLFDKDMLAADRRAIHPPHPDSVEQRRHAFLRAFSSQSAWHLRDLEDPKRVLSEEEMEVLWTFENYQNIDWKVDSEVPRWTPGACAWIEFNDQFKHWIAENQSSLLGIVGGIGTGKTSLMSFLIQGTTLRSLPGNPFLCAFVCNGKRETRNNAQVILRNILFQILDGRHDLMDHATKMMNLPMLPDQWPVSVLWKILRAILLDPKSGNLLIGIDAIDECEEDSRHRLMSLFTSFLKETHADSANTVKFFISSRDKADFMEKDSGYGRIINLSEIEETKLDLRLAIKYQLDELQKFLCWSDKCWKELEARILNKAGLNARWVREVVSSMKLPSRNKDKNKLYEIIDDTPLKEETIAEHLENVAYWQHTLCLSTLSIRN